jgi:uncharacterized membrane protein
MFGQNNAEGKPICFDCSDFSSSVFAHQIIEAVNSGEIEADENMLQDFSKYVNKKFIPTSKLQAQSMSDKLAVWLVANIGTMPFLIACFILVNIPIVFPKTLEVVNFIGGSYISLLLMPLIMIAGNLQQKRAEMREEAEFRLSIKQDIEIEWLTYRLDKIQKWLDSHKEIT